jgi:ferredoxin-NADP reductase
MAQPTQRYILKSSHMLCPRVKYFVFTKEDNAPIPFIPGQFITINIETDEINPNTNKNKILHRSYSIANVPGESNQIELACAFVDGGVASNLLFNLQQGDSVNVSGPFGLFTLKEEQPARYILIATGTGVAPYRSMVQELKKRLISNANLQATVIQGVRSRAELLFEEEFASLHSTLPNFTFKACYSRESLSPAELKPYEQLGRVNHVFSELNLNPSQDIIYLCGNPNMIDDAYNTLTELGFDRKSIRREKYTFSH